MIGPTAATHLKFHREGHKRSGPAPRGAMAMRRDVNDSSRSSVSRMAFDWDRDALGRFFLQHTHCKLPAHGKAHSLEQSSRETQIGDRAAFITVEFNEETSVVRFQQCLQVYAFRFRVGQTSHTLQSGPPRSGYDRFVLASLEYLGIVHTRRPPIVPWCIRSPIHPCASKVG